MWILWWILAHIGYMQYVYMRAMSKSEKYEFDSDYKRIYAMCIYKG